MVALGARVETLFCFLAKNRSFAARALDPSALGDSTLFFMI